MAESTQAHIHEAVDRVHMVSLHLDAAFKGHPAEKLVGNEIKDAEDAIGALYQKLGEHIEEDEE